MKYHTGRRFGLAESVQSMIYWTCMNYEHLDDQTRALIGQAARVSGHLTPAPAQSRGFYFTKERR